MGKDLRSRLFLFSEGRSHTDCWWVLIMSTHSLQSKAKAVLFFKMLHLEFCLEFSREDTAVSILPVRKCAQRNWQMCAMSQSCLMSRTVLDSISHALHFLMIKRILGFLPQDPCLNPNHSSHWLTTKLLELLPELIRGRTNFSISLGTLRKIIKWKVPITEQSNIK
jgi:hypothetical protein